MRRLQQVLEEPELRPDGIWSQEQVAYRVARLENATEPLVRLFAMLGRRGKGHEFALVGDVLKALGRETILGGTVFYIKLLNYPSVMATYSYGPGALQAVRYDTLFKLFSIPVRNESRDRTCPLVLQKFLWDWEGGGDHC